MNKNKIPVSLLLLAAILMSVITAIPANASLGDVYHTVHHTIRPGLDYTSMYSGIPSDSTDTSFSAELRSYLLEYTPGSGFVIPQVTWGEYIYGRSAIDEMLSRENSPTAAVNADFFSLQTGVPLGIITRGDTLYSNSETKNALIITSSSAEISQPQIKIELTDGINTAVVDYYNKYPTKYGTYLLSNDWGVSTRSSSASREIVLTPTGSSNLKLNSNISCIVSEVRKDVKNSDIPPGCFVLTYQNNGTASGNAMLNSLKSGDLLTLTVIASEDISSPDTVLSVGGGDLILDNGFFDESLADESHEKQRNPRTAVGITADGRVLFYACDGRSKSHSEGLTLSELAGVMLELGCVDAMNLDGGGSTTVVVEGKTVNKPSDGKQRAVSDAVVFLDNPAAAQFINKSLHLTTEYEAVLMNGGRTGINTYLKFENWTVGDMLPDDGILYEVYPSEAGVIENGVFTAGNFSGTAIVSATCNIGEGPITGSVSVNVVPHISKLMLTSDYDKLASNGRLQIEASASYRNIDVGVSLEQLEFFSITDQLPDGAVAVTPIGTLYHDGILIGNGDSRSAGTKTSLTASIGGLSTSLPILYGIADTVIESFENTEKITGQFSQTTNLLKYVPAVETSGTISFTEPISLYTGAMYFTMWTTNDADAGIVIEDSNGDRFDLKWMPDIVLNRHGWTKNVAVIPSEAVQPIKVISPIVCHSGSITASDFSVSYGNPKSLFDDLPPEHWAFEYVSAVSAMGIISGYKDTDSITYRPDSPLTRAEFAKLLSSYFSLHQPPSSSLNFADPDFPQWAAPYVSAVVKAGLMNGKSVTDAGIIFDPDSYITRAEVMQVFGNLIDCAEADLKIYKDSADIPDWAYKNAAKTAASGIVTGYPDMTLLPSAFITRSEIAVMFVRFDRFVSY